MEEARGVNLISFVWSRVLLVDRSLDVVDQTWNDIKLKSCKGDLWLLN